MAIGSAEAVALPGAALGDDVHEGEVARRSVGKVDVVQSALLRLPATFAAYRPPPGRLGDI